MAEHPILIFPTATTVARDKPQRRLPKLGRPSPAQQHFRLTQKFRTIANGFEQLRQSPDGMEPERVVVLEAAKPVADVAKAARRVPGLEWLDEFDGEEIEPVAGFAYAKDPSKPIPFRLFALMGNQRAMNELLTLWAKWPKEWESAEGTATRAPTGFGPFKSLFQHLIDVRSWGPKDRVQDTILRWIANLEFDGDRPTRFEAELWFREQDSRRRAAEDHVRDLVREAGGRQVDVCVIEEIRYHGMLLEAPASVLQDLSRQIAESDHGGLVRCEDVMFFRPGPQSVSEIVDLDDAAEDKDVRSAAPEGPPTVAIFDGLPLERHAALNGRLIIDDPDGLAERYRPGQQQHGTAMASLVVHGDLEDGEAFALPRPVYVRPVLAPVETGPNKFEERCAEDRLFVDVIHRSVRRLFDGDGEEPPVAPSVRLINLSIGNDCQRFDRQLSPLAKLLDWLSSKYNVLFLVASGNQVQDIEIVGSWDDFRALNDNECALAVLRAMDGDQIQRRLYSPAESINALTIGALHDDFCKEGPVGSAIDLFRGQRVVSPFGSVASGFRRSVKPELLMPGGKQLYNRSYGQNNGGVSFTVASAVLRPPGQKTAAPGQADGGLWKYYYTRGTSNATALATRAGAVILDRLLELRQDAAGELLDDSLLPVAVKALLVHGCAWGDIRAVVESIAPPTWGWEKQRRLVARYLGYGAADITRSMFATDQRVVMLGCARVAADESHVYDLPLPTALSGLKNRRRLTATLASITPVNCLHRDYRRSALTVKIGSENGGFDATDEVHDQLSAAGTVQHLMYSTERAVPIDEGSTLELKVSCRPAAGKLVGTVPYALAVTLEVADPIETSIYEQIRDAIRSRARVR